MALLNAAVVIVEGFLDSPEEHFVRPKEDVAKKCSQAAKAFFECGKQGAIKGGPLMELLVDGFDSEQIWQQIELENQPLLLHFEAQLTALQQEEGEKPDTELETQDELEDALDEGDEGDEGDELLEFEEEDTLVGQKRRADPAPSETAAKKYRADRDPALGGNVLTFDDQSSGEDEGEEDEGDLNRDENEGDAAGGLDDDPFFDAEEMNKFADEGIDDFDEDQDQGQDEGDENDEEEAGEMAGMKYNDFFDAPPPKTKKNSAGPAAEDDALLSAFQKNDRDMKRRIAAIEDELVQPRPWILTGEVPAKARPSESLLQEDLDFEYATRPTEGLTEEGSKKIEDIIRGRIVDGLFDDVERKQTPKKKAFKPVEEVSTAKSEVGLAEVYEREFLELAKGDDEPTAAEAKLNKEHEEIAVLFGQLCHKLDSLCDFSFTPKPPTEEITVITNAPAISMEEVVPMGTSSGTLIAPEEEYKSKSTGKPVGSTEMEQKEKRTRRARQKRLHAARAETRAREKGPDKKAEKKEIESVLNQRHVKEGVVSDATNYAASKEVFAKLTQSNNTAADPFARKKKEKATTQQGPHTVQAGAGSFKL